LKGSAGLLDFADPVRGETADKVSAMATHPVL